MANCKKYHGRSVFVKLFGMVEVVPGLLLGNEVDAMGVISRLPHAHITKHWTVTHILTISNEPLNLSGSNAVMVESEGCDPVEREDGEPDMSKRETSVKSVDSVAMENMYGGECVRHDDVKAENSAVKSDRVGDKDSELEVDEKEGNSVEEKKKSQPRKILVKFVRMADMPKSDLLHQFEPCCQFIQGAIRTGGTMLVHCVHGISRSVTMVVAYQMWSERRSFQVVYDEIKRKRIDARPNPGFIEQLKLWGAMGCRYDNNNKQYKAYRLQTKAREMKDTGYTDVTGLSPDPSTNTVDSSAYYRCRKCRRLLFTGESVLPHEVGKGDTAFKWHKRSKPGSPPALQPHPLTEQFNQTAVPSSNTTDKPQIDEQGSTQQTIEQGSTQQTIEQGSTQQTVEQGSIKQSDIVSAVSPNELAKIRAQVAEVMSQPVSNERCSSWFIEPVEWMESSLLGTVEGKVLCPKCSARLGSFNWSGDQCSCGQWVTPSFQIHKSRVDETRTLCKRKMASTK